MTTLRQFLLKKFPTNKYFDCPISKDTQEIMEEYAELKLSEYIKSTQPKEIINSSCNLCGGKGVKWADNGFNPAPCNCKEVINESGDLDELPENEFPLH